jgi:ribosomal protein L40E
MNQSNPPPVTAARGALGGAADEAGGNLRASVAAWAVSFGLAGRPLPIGELPQDTSSVPVGVRLETDAPVDDIQIDLRNGGRVFVQVKSGVSVSESDPTFASVLGQFSAVVKEQNLEIRRDRLVLAVARKTGPLDSLFLGWQRSKTSLAGQPTERERKALALADKLTPTLTATEHEILRKVACGVEFTAESEITAQSVLASGVVAASDAARAFRELKAISRDLAKNRLGLRIEEWAERLICSKITLTCDPNGSESARWEARRRAVRRYRADLVRRAITLDIRPLGAAVPPIRHRLATPRVHDMSKSSRSRDESAFDVAARRRGRILLLGLPGSGKSTALRHLAAEWARDPSAPLPVVVSLRDVVPLLDTQHPFDAFIQAAVLNVRSSDRLQLADEFRARATDGRIALLMDALDETREARFRVVQTIERVRRELNPDATVVLSTRDSGYAAASTLGMVPLRLKPIRTPEYTLRRILLAFAKKHDISDEHTTTWINERLSWIGAALDHDYDLAETPLGGILLALLAAEPHRHALPRGRAKTLSAVVDGVVERWELSQRQRPNDVHVGALRASEAVAALKESFAQIGYRLLHSSEVTASDVKRDLAGWLHQRWGLAAGPADVTASEMFAFWDEAGIFMASEAAETIGARLQLLAEIAAARHIAMLEPDKIQQEVERFAASEVSFEVASLAAGLSDRASTALVAFCVTRGDVKWDLKAAKHLREGSHHLQSGIDVAQALARDAHRADAADERWAAAKAIALLPVPLTLKDSLLQQFSALLTEERYRVARAICQAAERLPIDDPLAVLQAIRWTLRPEKHSSNRPRRLVISPEDDEVGDLLVHITEYVLPHTPELADSLVDAGHDGSMRLWQRLDAVLYRIGRSDIVEARNQKFFQSLEQVGGFDMRSEWLRFLTIVGGLAPPKALSFAESWRLDELVDFFATLRICTSEAGAVPSALYYSEEDVRSLVRLASTLGRFNPAVLAAESRLALALEERKRSTTLLCEAGKRRELRYWQDADSGAIDVAIELLRGTPWLGRIASEALAHCPSPDASDRIEQVFGEIRPINRLHAGSAILALDDGSLERAIRWEQSTDPFTRQLAASSFARQEADASARGHLERAFSDIDRGVRVTAVRGLRGKVLPESLRQRLEDLAAMDAPVGYACMRCGTPNPTDRTSCTKCNVVGPDLKAEVKKLIEPSSTSSFEDDEED